MLAVLHCVIALLIQNHARIFTDAGDKFSFEMKRQAMKNRNQNFPAIQRRGHHCITDLGRNLSAWRQEIPAHRRHLASIYRAFWVQEQKVEHDDGNYFCDRARTGGRMASLNTNQVHAMVTRTLPRIDKTTIWLGAHCQACVQLKTPNWFWQSGDELSLSSPNWGYSPRRRLPYDE